MYTTFTMSLGTVSLTAACGDAFAGGAARFVRSYADAARVRGATLQDCDDASGCGAHVGAVVPGSGIQVLKVRRTRDRALVFAQDGLNSDTRDFGARFSANGNTRTGSPAPARQ